MMVRHSLNGSEVSRVMGIIHQLVADEKYGWSLEGMFASLPEWLTPFGKRRAKPSLRLTRESVIALDETLARMQIPREYKRIKIEREILVDESLLERMYGIIPATPTSKELQVLLSVSLVVRHLLQGSVRSGQLEVFTQHCGAETYRVLMMSGDHPVNLLETKEPLSELHSKLKNL